MIEKTANLGKLKNVYPVSSVYLQRAVVLVVLSFLFFLAMMIAFYIRQNIGYFLLATAFLLVKLMTLFGWLNFRKTEVRVYENGFSFKNKNYLWFEIKEVSLKVQTVVLSKKEKHFCLVSLKNGEEIVISDAISNINGLFENLSNRSLEFNNL